MGGKKRSVKPGELRTFMRIVALAKPYWLRLCIGMLAAVLGGGSLIALFIGAQGAMDWLFGDAPDAADAAKPQTQIVALSDGDGDSALVDLDATEHSAARGWVQDKADKYFGKLVDEKRMETLKKRGFSGIVWLCVVLFAVTLVNSAAQFTSAYCLEWVGQRTVMDLRLKLFHHLQELSLSFYNSSRVGDMISRTVADTQLLQTTVTNVITDAIRQPVKLLMVFTFVVVFEWRLALFSMLLFPTVVVPIVLIGRRLRRISREGQKRLADITSVMKESLDGVSVVKAFGQEAREEARFAEQCRGFFRQMIRAVKAKALNEPITHTIGGLAGMAVLLYATLVGMPISRCIIFAASVFFLYDPLKRLGRISMDIQQSSGAADRVFEIIDTPVSVADSPTARDADGALSEIEFRDVSFSYGEKRVFDGLSLKIQSGESLAVVGPSGGGKTTLVSLLLRFFDPDSGAITRNGVDFRTLTLSSLRSRIGLVLQDTFLFNATIAENIAYGKPDATREEIVAAAKLAHADEFIRAKENGYDTVVGERGVALSGGQKQRIAIARALIRKPEMLILDEATSALDTDSERAVQAAIDDLMGHLTVIVIAHRLSTIAKCRRVAVVEKGGVTECGTHAELLKNENGTFAHLYKLQFETAAF